MTEVQSRGRVLVSGGASGIGRHIVQALCQNGYDVDFTFHSSGTQSGELRDALADAFPGRITRAHRVDLADPLAIEAFAKEIEDTTYYGLVYNAGRTCNSLAGAMDFIQARATMEVNFWGAAALTMAVLPRMRRSKRGRLVFISSVAGQRGVQGNAAYAASKAALEGYTRCLVPEVARRGITANCLAPGFIETPMVQSLEGQQDAIIREIPARRYGTCEEATSAVVFLLSEQAQYVNGASLVMDGGLTTTLTFG